MDKKQFELLFFSPPLVAKWVFFVIEGREDFFTFLCIFYNWVEWVKLVIFTHQLGKFPFFLLVRLVKFVFDWSGGWSFLFKKNLPCPPPGYQMVRPLCVNSGLYYYWLDLTCVCSDATIHFDIIVILPITPFISKWIEGHICIVRLLGSRFL